MPSSRRNSITGKTKRPGRINKNKLKDYDTKLQNLSKRQTLSSRLDRLQKDLIDAQSQAGDTTELVREIGRVRNELYNLSGPNTPIPFGKNYNNATGQFQNDGQVRDNVTFIDNNTIGNYLTVDQQNTLIDNYQRLTMAQLVTTRYWLKETSRIGNAYYGSNLQTNGIRPVLLSDDFIFPNTIIPDPDASTELERKGVPGGSHPETKIVMRGSTLPVFAIKDWNGFRAQGTEADLLFHTEKAQEYRKRSAYVSTTTSAQQAKKFATSNGFIYHANLKDVMNIDVENISRFPHEKEIVVPYHLPYSNIVKVTDVKTGKDYPLNTPQDYEALMEGTLSPTGNKMYNLFKNSFNVPKAKALELAQYNTYSGFKMGEKIQDILLERLSDFDDTQDDLLEPLVDLLNEFNLVDSTDAEIDTSVYTLLAWRAMQAFNDKFEGNTEIPEFPSVALSEVYPYLLDTIDELADYLAKRMENGADAEVLLNEVLSGRLALDGGTDSTQNTSNNNDDNDSGDDADDFDSDSDDDESDDDEQQLFRFASVRNLNRNIKRNNLAFDAPETLLQRINSRGITINELNNLSTSGKRRIYNILNDIATGSIGQGGTGLTFREERLYNQLKQDLS